jgi:hypothetical protein
MHWQAVVGARVNVLLSHSLKRGGIPRPLQRLRT